MLHLNHFLIVDMPQTDGEVGPPPNVRLSSALRYSHVQMHVTSGAGGVYFFQVGIVVEVHLPAL